MIEEAEIAEMALFLAAFSVSASGLRNVEFER